MRVAAIDQGTTSTRCFVIEDGSVWTMAGARRHAQHHPAAGWVEQDPEEILENIESVLAAAGPVDAIGLSNQGESCLAWDAETGKPLSPIVVWQDARTAEALSQREPAAGKRSKEICGLPLDPYFSASKLAWLLQNLPAVSSAFTAGRLRLGTTDAFFLDRLCGSFKTDLATASRTGLLDLRAGAWSAELCEVHGVPMQCLPKITSVDAGFGKIGDIPVKVSIVDQQAALYGHKCRKSGDCKITFGTGAFLLAVTGEECLRQSDLLPTVAWQCRQEKPVFAIEGGVYDAGSALEWIQSMGLFSTMEELGGFEGPSALSRGIVFVPALSGLAAPFWDRRAAPLFIGMDHSTSRRDMVRTVLEGIAMLTVDLIEAAAKAVKLGSGISIDGGLSQSGYFAQFLATASNRSITVPQMHERTAIGLAEFCGIDTGSGCTTAQTFEPDGTITAADRVRFAEAVERARGWRS